MDDIQAKTDTKGMRTRNETLQALCRDYLGRLRYMGKKHGIDVDSIIRANKRKECEATNKEVEMLSRCVDDERVSRTDIPKMLGKSYRQTKMATLNTLKNLNIKESTAR